MVLEMLGFSSSTFALLTVLATSGLAGVVLPWTRRQLATTVDAVAYLGEITDMLYRQYVAEDRPRVAAKPAMATNKIVELPEISWDLAGDWTTAAS